MFKKIPRIRAGLFACHAHLPDERGALIRARSR
jgi:hypothetical protein